MAWTVPITIEGQTYPVRFDSENEPTQEDIEDAANYIISQQSATQEDTGQGRLSTFASGVARGALSPVPGIIGGVGALTGSETLRDTAESIEQGINETFPMNPAYEEEFWTGKAPQAIGQGISMLAMGGVGGAVGKGLAAGRGLSQAGQAAAATQAATRTMLSTGAAMGARGGQQEGEQYGLTGANLYGRIVAGALIEPFTEKLGGMGAETQALRRFLLGDAMAAGRMSSKRIIATEAGEEGVAQILGDTATNVGTVIEGTEGIGIGEMASRAGESTALGAVAGLPFAGANIIAGRMQPEEPFTFGGIHAREEGDIPIVDSGVIVATIPNGSPLTVDDVMAMTPEQRMEAANKLQIKIPRPSSVVAAELTAMAASGRPVPVDPQAIRPQDAGAVTAATQTNPETLAAVVAMTTNTTPVAAPQNATELQRRWQALEDRALAATEAGATDRLPAIRDEQRRIADQINRSGQRPPAQQPAPAPAPVAPATPAPAIDNVDELVRNGGGIVQVSQDGRRVSYDKFALMIDGDQAEVAFVELNQSERGKGIGVAAYEQLGMELAARGITLQSSKAQYGPGRNMWLKLASKGLAKLGAQGVFSFTAPTVQSEASKPTQEIVAGVEELTDEEARAIDAELGINPDLGTGEFSERDAMRIIGQEPITPPTAVEQPQTQQTNEVQDTLQDQEQVGPQEADAQADAQAQEGLLAPTVAPSPEGAAITPQPTQPPQPNVQNQIQAETVQPQTANGKRVGDAINPGENISVASEKDESSPEMPTEYTVLEVETIANAKKNEVHARRRDMTPDEIARTQQKIRERNELAAELGMPQEAIPEVPSPQPAATEAGTAQRSGQGQEVVRDATKPEQMSPEEFASSANQPWNLAPEDETSYMTRGGAVSVGNTIQKLGAGKDVGTFRGHQVKTETAWNSDESTGRFVIEDGGKVVASIKLNRDRTVEHLAVSPEYRASGMANALLDAADQFGGIDLVGTKDKSRLGGIAMHRWAINKAIANKEPISVAAVEQYQMPRPIGYKQQGEMFVPAQESGRSPALQNAEQRAAAAAQETGNSPEVELQAIIETPQYGQEWLQEQVEQAREEGVEAGDTVVAQDETGETIIGTVAATTGETTTVSTTSGDVTVPTAGLVRQAPQSLSRKPGLAQALMESDGAALQLGISQQDVERGIAATRRQIPGASNIWSGTRQAFLDTFGNDPAVQDMVQQLEEGVMTEGFYVPSLQRGFLFTDSVVVYQGDADRAALNGTTPAVEAAKRLIRHEVGGHGGWMTLTQKQQRQFMDIAKDVIPISDMNQMIEDGYPFQDWQTDEEIYRQAAEEWFSQRLGRLDKLPKTGPMARFVDWLKGVWRWLTGRKGDPDLDAIKNLWRQIRMNQAAMATGRAWYSLPRQGAGRQVSDARDAEYLAAVEAGDMETAQRMVDEAAKAAGYLYDKTKSDIGGSIHGGKVFHGTNKEFNEFRTGVNFGGSRGFKPNDIGAWLSKSKELAEAFASDAVAKGGGVARVIGAYLNLKNPKIYTSYGQFLRDTENRRSASAYKSDLQKEGYDGIEIRNSITDIGGDPRTDFVAFNPNQIKSADPVTYDDQGNPVPLSQRFQSTSSDIRYSRQRESIEIQRFNELTRDLPVKPTSADIAKFQETHPDEYAELVKMRADVLKRGGWTFGPVYHGTKELFNIFNPTRYEDKLSYFALNKKFSEKWVENRLPPKGSEVANRIERVRNESREFVNDLFEKTPGAANDLELAAELFEQQKQFERDNLDGMTVYEAERKMGGRIIAAYLKANNVFDPSKSWREFLPQILRYLNVSSEAEIDPQVMRVIKDGGYLIWENKSIVDAVLSKYDALMIQEEQGGGRDTIAIRGSENIKSADPLATDDSGNLITPDQWVNKKSGDIRYSRVRSNAEIASAIRQQATLPNDPQTASEGKVIRDDVAAQFEPNERQSIQQAPPHELFSKNMGVDKGAAILDTLMQPERDPSKMAEMTPAEIEQRGGDVELNLIAHEEAVRRALVLGDAVSSSALARYGIPLPTGYRKFGELSAPVSPSLIRAVEFLTNQSLTEEAGIGMATTIYPYIAYRLMTDIANTITTAKSNVERVALSQAMSRIYEATSGINSMAGQRLGATGIAQRYFGVTAGGVMALVENTNKEIQGRIDASVPVDDLVAEINRLKAEIERLTAEESGDQINADTDVEVAEADMLKQEGIAEQIIEEIANRLGDAPVTNDVERKEREQTIRDLHLRNVRQGMTEQQFIAEAAAFEVYEGLASRLWNVGNLEREARATIKAAIDGIRRQEIAESRASRLIYSTEERLRQGSKDLDTNTSGDSINKAFRDQIKTPVSLTDFKERLSKLSVGGDVAERLFRTAEREMADLAEMDAIISRRREEKKKAAQVEIAESRASQLIYSVEERLRQGSKDLEQGSGKDTLNKAFRDQVKSPVSQEDFSKRLAALNVGQAVSDRLFKTAERERLDLEKAQEFTAQRRADTQQAREIERAEARASQLIYKTEEKLRQGSKDLDEGEGRDSINKAFRDQIESPVSLADFKARLASLKVGDTVADRLFKTAERERIDLAEAERFTAQRRLERKEQRQIEIAQERASQLIYGVEERLRQGSKDLTESPSRDTINKAFRDQVSKPVSFEQFQARLRNLRVNDRNIERMFNTAERERIDLGTQQMMRDRANLLESESPHLAAIIRRIKDRIAPGISWRDLMVVDAQDGQERIREIYRRVRKHEALRNLSPAEAVQLSNALNRHFLKAKEKVLRKELQRVGATGTPIDPRVATLFEQIRQGKLTAAQAEAEIQAIVQQSRWKTLRKELPNFLQDLAYGRVTIDQFAEKLGRGRKASDRAMQHVIDSTPKLIQAMNLGAFNAQAFRDAVSEQFGLKVITSEQAREIQQMVINAQKLQPGLPRDKAVAAIIDRIADYTSMSGAEIFNSFWVSSVLSGGRTQFDTWMNQLNAMRRVLQLAAWTSAKRVNQGGVSIGWSAITRYFEVLPGMFQNALYYLWSGDSSLLLSEARETDRFLNNGQFSQSMDTKKAERLLSGAVSALGRGDFKNGIMAFPAFFIVGVRRLMQAADYFSAAATLEASIPLAIALNPELAGDTRIPSRKDYANFRKRAREILTGGREPASTKEKVEERILSQQLLMQSIDSLALRDEIMELGIEASYQNDPTGIGGIFYNSVLAVHQKIVASAEALRERGQAVQESNSPEMLKKADMAARNLMYALAVGARALTGLQFARFAGNKTNELLGMTPIIGLARLAEKDKTRSQRSMIIMDNVVGTAIAVGGIIYAMGLLEDDDDDERRGWRIEGGWDGLTADETRQLRAAGKQPYSIGYLDRQDGTWKNYSYLQWATSGAFATVGNLRDRKRYRPELWNEDNFVGATLAAAAGNGQALMNMSMLQNLNDIFGGNNAYTARDPVQGMATWLNRFASSYAGGFIPRAFKDADYMMDPRHTKANAGIELWLQHVPFYRRGIGEPYLDSLGYQVELRREPWSRAFVETQGTAAHNALSSLVGNGIFISSLNMDNRVVRRGEDVRPMTDAEQKRMMDFYFPALRRYLVTEGPRLERMPMDAAKDKISRDIQNLKSDAQDRAVR